MSILIPPGRSWLRLQLVSPANFGSTGGRATLDRPVALDSWTALPFLPFSALTGVLAGRFGELRDSKRTPIFGSGDDEPASGPASAGRPGDVTLGDGEIFCFPAPLRNGRVAHVIPMTTVMRLARLGFLSCPMPRVSNASLAYTMVEGLPSGIETDADPSIVPSLLLPLAPLAGKPPENLVLAAPDAARSLWRSASEVRTLTAISGRTRTLRGGSLRRVELLPPGTILLSLVTNQSRASVNLGSPRLQLGAWESWGCGYVEARALVTDAAPAAKLPPGRKTETGQDVDTHDDMINAFSAVADMPDSLRTKVRPVLRETATRIRNQGVASTLAFLLAKAKFAASANTAATAHGWLLTTLFPEDDVYRATVEAITGRRPTNQIEGLCHWLSRYAELPPYVREESTTGGDGS